MTQAADPDPFDCFALEEAERDRAFTPPTLSADSLRRQRLVGELNCLVREYQERVQAAKTRLGKFDTELGLAVLRAAWNRRHAPELARLLRERQTARELVELLPLLEAAVKRVSFQVYHRFAMSGDVVLDLGFLDEPRTEPGPGWGFDDGNGGPRDA